MLIILYIVFMAGRGNKDRIQVDGVHAQVLQIIQLSDDAGDVPDAVAVGIGKAAGVDLIDDPALPPVGAVGIRS